MYGGGVKISDLVSYLEKQEFISEKEVLFHVEKSLKELREREKICDIQMSDVIVKNYKSRQIFYATNHPTQDILFELAKRILKFIGINDMNFDNLDLLLDEKYSLYGQDIPIYPKVKKILGLQNSEPVYYANRYLWPFNGNYIEYLTEYAKWCWKDKIF